MDMLVRKIKAFKDLGATDEYINDILVLINHEKRKAGLEFKKLFEANLAEAPEQKVFKLMDKTSIDKVMNKTKKEWLSK